jgi:hypothetical protein
MVVSVVVVIVGFVTWVVVRVALSEYSASLLLCSEYQYSFVGCHYPS